jgi:two-component SAPR family response regulator
VTDIDLFEEAVKKFRLQKNTEAAQEIISLYKGEYLADFEALWAINKKIRYSEAYREALSFSKNVK